MYGTEAWFPDHTMCVVMTSVSLVAGAAYDSDLGDPNLGRTRVGFWRGIDQVILLYSLYIHYKP